MKSAPDWTAGYRYKQHALTAEQARVISAGFDGTGVGAWCVYPSVRDLRGRASSRAVAALAVGLLGALRRGRGLRRTGAVVHRCRSKV